MYSLRLYKTDPQGSFHSNVTINEFKPTGNKNVHVCSSLSPDILNLNYNYSMLQVYPGNKEKTFYDIQSGNQLFVYCQNNNVFILKCATIQNDVYLYFKPDKSTDSIFIVEAPTAAAALDLLLLLK